MNRHLTAPMLVKDLHELLDPTTMADFGPNGLIITNEGPLTKIATAFSPCLSTITKAAQAGVQALITHHGLNDVFPITNSILYQKIKLLMLNNIALIRYHLPLDAHRELGNNWKAAQELGWQNLEPFGEYQGTIIGVQGSFAPIGIDEFVARLEKYYGNKAQVAPAKKEVSSAALISGGAHKYFKEAIAAGVDCYITGTCDEPVWDMAYEAKVSFCALGHAATEKIGPKALAAYIQKNYRIETVFLDTVNPF